MKTTYYLLVITIFTLFSTNLLAQKDEVFKIVEQMPTFGDCTTIEDRTERKTCSDQSVYNFIAENIAYPDSATIKRTEGTVVVRFIIDKEGVLKDATVVKDIGDGCGDEALRVINMMGPWNAGTQKGEKVDVQLHLPVKFKVKEVIVQTEKFLTLNDLFCADYLTDFITEDVIHNMADDELLHENVCSVSTMRNGILKLRVGLTQNGKLEWKESEDGSFTDEMRALLLKSKVGDVIELDYDFLISFNDNNFLKTVYKSVIIE